MDGLRKKWKDRWMNCWMDGGVQPKAWIEEWTDE